MRGELPRVGDMVEFEPGVYRMVIKTHHVADPDCFSMALLAEIGKTSTGTVALQPHFG